MTAANQKNPCSESKKAGVTIAVVESLSELRQYRQQIDSISSVPFLKTSWIFPWIKVFCESDSSSYKLKFLLATDQDEKLIGFAPLVLRNSLKKGNHLCFVGSGKACADYMTFPVRPSHRAEFIESLADWFLSQSGWDRVELDGAVADDATLREFAEEMERRTCRTEQVPTLAAWRMELPSSWDDVLSGFSKNSRKK